MRILIVLLLLPSLANAESYVALRTIQARTVLVSADLTSVDAEIPGAVGDPLTVIGQEARVTIFAGHPIMMSDFVPPTLVERNQIVSLLYVRGTLQIVTEGRALERAGSGQMVRVMNLSSRATVSGLVTETGAVRVGPEYQQD